MRLLDKQQLLEFVHSRHQLFDQAGQANPFACSAWVIHFIEQVAADDWTFAIPSSDCNGESLMLLYQDLKSPRRAAALANCYTSLYSPLIGSARDRPEALRALVRDLVECRPARTAIELGPLDGESPDTAALARAFAEEGWYVKRFFYFGNWYQPSAGLSFEDYMVARDSRLFNTWSRKAKKFKPGNPDGARLEMVTGLDGLEAAMDAYDRIYARSWKMPEAYPAFVRGWARICARNGWLRLGIAWIGNVPVAAQFWFTLHGRANIFKLAYDEEYGKWSAGTVLTAHMFRHALEMDRVVEIDYLTGDDPYKQSWMNSRRERIGLLACNPGTLQGLALAARDMAARLYRQWRPTAPSGNGGRLEVSP